MRIDHCIVVRVHSKVSGSAGWNTGRFAFRNNLAIGSAAREAAESLGLVSDKDVSPRSFTFSINERLRLDPRAGVATLDEADEFDVVEIIKVEL